MKRLLKCLSAYLHRVYSLWWSSAHLDRQFAKGEERYQNKQSWLSYACSAPKIKLYNHTSTCCIPVSHITPIAYLSFATVCVTRACNPEIELPI